MDMTQRPDVAMPDARDRQLLAAIHGGLPLVSRPYAEVGAQLDMPEAEVVKRLERLLALGVIKRFGIVVRHHELGYRANAMVVWDVPDGQASEIGRRLARLDFVTLCYRRARSLPAWRYNLYCMIHGRDRATVQRHIAFINGLCGLNEMPHAVLFSRRRFKQCGADYRGGVKHG
jgi:DNA-binding Lrp family transcriptional regulator